MVKFKVWYSDNVGEYYAHMIFGNGKTVFVTEGYREVRGAFNACQKAWDNVRVTGISDIPAPVPYTRDSLRPIPAGKKGKK